MPVPGCGGAHGGGYSYWNLELGSEGGAWLALLAQKLREGPPEAGTSERHTRLIPERLEKARAWN